MQCALFSDCQNPERGFSFVCDRFEERAIEADENFSIPHFDFDFANSGSGKLVKSGAIDLGNMDFSKLSPQQYDEFDMTRIIEKVRADFATGLPRDFRVDTSDLPLAKNFMDFSTNVQYMNQDENLPWAKQVQIITNLMTEICYNPKCTDVEFARNMPVTATLDQIQERVTFLEHGVCPCPSCRATKIDQWNTYGVGRYNELMGIGGQRGSKTQTVNRGTKYFLHQCLKLPRPHKVFGIEEATSIEMTFTATLFGKAKENLYDPLVYSLRNSPWFKQYHELLDDIGRRTGEELYKVLDHSTIYRANRYHIYPASPNPQNMRGATRILAEIDEISHLYTKTKDAVKLNPGELRNALRNSLLTLRMAHTDLVDQGIYNVPTPMMMNITSPRTYNDTGMRIYRESLKPKSRIYGFHYSVYEMNPNATKSEEMMEELKQIERESPEDFKRDFLAIPPNASNAFISNIGAIQGCIIRGHSNAIQTKDVFFTGSRKSVKLQSANYQTIKNKKIDTTTPKVLTIDAGKSDNSFAIVIGHNETVEENDFEKSISVFDALIEIIPRDDHVLSYNNIMEEILFPVIEEFNVQIVYADRWNSLQLLQTIADEFDIHADQYSLKYRDFLNFRRSLYEEDLGFPMAENQLLIKNLLALSTDNYPECFIGKPIAHFFFQCLTVEDIMNKTVDKGTGYTDDLFRAAVLNHWVLNNDEMLEILESSLHKQAPKQAFVGAVGSMGGGITLLGGGSLTQPNVTNGRFDNQQGFVGVVGSNAPIGGNR